MAFGEDLMVFGIELKNIINLMIEKDQHKRPDSAKIFEIIKSKYNSKEHFNKTKYKINIKKIIQSNGIKRK